MNPPTDTPTRITLPRTPEVLEAERAGIDLSLIEHNLSLTYEQRAIQHERALALVLELKRIRAKIHGNTQSAHSSTH